jgi:hypothetical protein
MDSGLWTAHLFHLFGHAWRQVLAWRSATTFSTVQDVIGLPVLIFIVTVFFSWKEWQAVHSVRSALRLAFKSFMYTAGSSIALLFVIFLCAIPFAVYRDHMDLVAANATLATKLKTPPPSPPVAPKRATGPTSDLGASTIRTVFPGDPFPIGRVVNLIVVWHNYGPRPIRGGGHHISKVYLRQADDLDGQKALIDTWEKFSKEELKKSQGDPVFHLNDDQNAVALSDEVVDEHLHQSLPNGEPPHLFVVSLVQFSDENGDHEAHACKELVGLIGQALQWRECSIYITPVDIPKRRA